MTRRSRLLLALFALPLISIRGESQQTSPKDILNAYLKIPFSQTETHYGSLRGRRLAQLGKLRSYGEEAVPAVAKAFGTASDPRHRIELTEALASFLHVPSSADELVLRLKDSQVEVRRQAVAGLRRMSSRVRLTGNPQNMRTESKPPTVPGLVPHLIRALSDEDEWVRANAVIGLAETLDPVALEAIRSSLQDPSKMVRLRAASLLSFFNDGSGLPVLQQSFERIVDTIDKPDVMFYAEAKLIIQAFGRITDVDLGPVPMQPALVSDANRIPEIKKQWNNLIAKWHQWWNEHPDFRPKDSADFTGPIL